MSEQRHSIKRQVIALTVRDATHADRLHAEVSRIYRQRIVPLIDRYCAELSAPDQLDRIERLELDLGAIDERHLEAELIARVSAALRPALAAQIAAQATSGRSSRADAWLELLALFARTGSLPWWADAATPQLLENGLRYLLANAADPLRRLMRQLAGEPGPLQRIIDHLPDDVLALLVAALAPAVAAPLAQQLPALLALLRDTPAAADWGPARLRRSAWSAILRVSGTAGPQYTSVAPLYQAVLRRVAAERGTAYAALLAELLAALGRERAGVEVPANAPLAQPGDDAPLAKMPSDLRERIQPQSARLEEPDVQSALAEEHALDIDLGTADALYIGNAGLVILWPFLPGFFARLGLLANERFAGIATQQRAAGLLQHLASGDTTFAEYLLPLNKLLCGLDPDAVFNFGEPLTDAETAECADFLGAVIAQAPILRDMSLDGFRGTFLLRQAALSARDGAWLLRVERQTYDIVLDRFPWGWEWLRLPWMDAPLRVEW